MNRNTIYNYLVQSKKNKQKLLAVLIDPDKVVEQQLALLIEQAVQAKVDLFFIGGSLIMDNQIARWIQQIKAACSIPIIIFPGSYHQVSEQADALFLLSLISGRNPDLLIGQHVLAAPMLAQMDLEIMSTGYILIDGGAPTTVSYISNSTPIPADKPPIAVCTAMAGEMLGMKIVYLDSGSGARQPVSATMIQAVSTNIQAPLIVGGGIRSPEQARKSCQAGADVLVIGTAFEKNPQLMGEIAAAIHAVEVKV